MVTCLGNLFYYPVDKAHLYYWFTFCNCFWKCFEGRLSSSEPALSGNFPAIHCTRVSVWGWSFVSGLSLNQGHLPGGVTMGHGDAITAVPLPHCPHMHIHLRSLPSPLFTNSLTQNCCYATGYKIIYCKVPSAEIVQTEPLKPKHTKP